MEASNLFNVNEMVFVITGGGTGKKSTTILPSICLAKDSVGIGAMMAKSLDANGAAKVYIVGRRKVKLDSVASEAKNKSIVPVEGDITSQKDLENVAKKVEEEVGFVNGCKVPTLS